MFINKIIYIKLKSLLLKDKSIYWNGVKWERRSNLFLDLPTKPIKKTNNGVNWIQYWSNAYIILNLERDWLYNYFEDKESNKLNLLPMIK